VAHNDETRYAYIILIKTLPINTTNISGIQLSAFFLILAKKRYIKAAPGSICVAKEYEIQSADECKNAALRFNLEWGGSINTDGNFAACYLHAYTDQKTKVFFNESPNPNREDPLFDLKHNRSAICKPIEGTRITINE